MPEAGQFLHTLQFNLEPPISFLSLLTALCISIFAMAFGEGLLQALWGNPLPTLIRDGRDGRTSQPEGSSGVWDKRFQRRGRRAGARGRRLWGRWPQCRSGLSWGFPFKGDLEPLH